MDKSYKARKEEFVSNLSGGSLLEINLVTLVAPAAVLLWSALQSRQSFFNPYRPIAFITDFLLNVGAILFAITAYSSIPLLLSILLVSPAILITFLPKNNGTKKAKPPRKDPKIETSSPPPSPSLPVRPFLTTYRGTMMVVTCLAILAVDFRIFPRRFAKVENWGTSLMDLGVGSFVFSAGVVSARSVLKQLAGQQKSHSLLQRLLSAITHSIPLFILGLIRLYSVKGLDYAEHVTEYGVHWNFFFTLAFLAPFVEIFHSLATTIIPSYEVLAVLLAVAYELVLETTALKAYILISPRGDSLLSKNREGIFSFIGYLAIFLAGRGTGMIVIPDAPPKTTSAQKSPPQSTGSSSPPPPAAQKSTRRSLLMSLTLRSLFWWSLYTISILPSLPIPPPQISNTTILDLGLALHVSRRLANLPYVLWVTAFNTSQILLFCLIETWFFPAVHHRRQITQNDEDEAAEKATPKILELFNKHGLPVFLISNLLTGLVNLSVDTLGMGHVGSMAVLMGYAGAVTGVAMGLEWSGLRLRFLNPGKRGGKGN